MAIESLEDNWKADLDDEGRALFEAMIDAEHRWCAAFRAAGAALWQHWRPKDPRDDDDFQKVTTLMPRPRRVLVAAPPGTPIPHMGDLLRTRAEFGAWLREEDDRLGKQSTASPAVITPTGAVSATSFGTVSAARTTLCTWSKSEAFRSGILTMDEAEAFLLAKVHKAEAARDSAEMHRQWDRYRKAEERITEAEGHLAALRAIPGKGSDLVARLLTGSGWTFRARWSDAASTPFHVPHVVVLPANPDTFTLKRAPTRKAPHRLGERLGEFGRLAVFRIAR